MSERLHHLDGLRGIAALVVVLHHHVLAFNFALYSGRTQDSQLAGDVFLSGFPLTPAMPAGLAVCLFFVLSGYVLARASLKSPLGLLGQGTKRYVRLAIPILCVSILTWIFSALGLMRNKQMAAVVQSAWLPAGQYLDQPGPARLHDILRDARTDGILGELGPHDT